MLRLLRRRWIAVARYGAGGALWRFEGSEGDTEVIAVRVCLGGWRGGITMRAQPALRLRKAV